MRVRGVGAVPCRAAPRCASVLIRESAKPLCSLPANWTPAATHQNARVCVCVCLTVCESGARGVPHRTTSTTVSSPLSVWPPPHFSSCACRQSKGCSTAHPQRPAAKPGSLARGSPTPPPYTRKPTHARTHTQGPQLDVTSAALPHPDSTPVFQQSCCAGQKGIHSDRCTAQHSPRRVSVM